jgi:hypothetical protein
MAQGFNYGQLLNKACLAMIADVLSQVAQDGLPGKHHFYITFDTTHPGVDMAQSLRERYPKTMMIVIQEWYADLVVLKDRFTITLNFGNVPEAIVIPFDAITIFADPSVSWGMRFEAHEEGEEEDVPGDGDGGGEGGGDDAPPPSPPGDKPEGTVVSLDKFRKG